jgi:hypothetical protein
MGTITINIDNNTEGNFREVVKQEYGIGKSKLSKAVSEAVNHLSLKGRGLRSDSRG